MADLFLNLGIDFGTSFTKVVVCDTSRENSWVINFSDKKSTLQEALLPSKIGITHQGFLLAGLTDSEWKKANQEVQMYIHFIKMRLANLDLQEEGLGHPSDELPCFEKFDLNESEIIENLCVYYLSQVIVRAKNWVIKHNHELVKSQEIEWSANVGVPVKYFESKAITRFQKVLKLAWLLSSCSNAKKSSINLTHLTKQIKPLRKNVDNVSLPCEAIPEIAAAIYSYTTSRQAQEKPTIFFDVGSGTIEGSAFLFKRESGLPTVEFYSGEVEPLGVEAIAKRCAIHLRNSSIQDEIVNDLVFESERLLEEIYKLSRKIARPAKCGEKIANKVVVAHSRVVVQEVEKQLSTKTDTYSQKLLHLIICQSLIHLLVAKTTRVLKEKLPDYLRELLDKKENLLVFLGGGGSQSFYFRDTIHSTHSAFIQSYIPLPEYEINNVSFPLSFEMGELPYSEFHRFLIAYGLSTNNTPEIKGYPKQFPEIKPPKLGPYQPAPGNYRDQHDSM